MGAGKTDVLKAGKWLAEQRRVTGASTKLVATLATGLANRQGDPITIHQQQLSDIENATEDKGPKTLRPWFRYVRAAFDSGLVADALGPDRSIGPPKDASDIEYLIRSSSGEVIGRLIWFAEKSH